MKSRHYVRVYFDDLMHDYPDVWSDDRLLSTWLRLLVLVDAVWPMTAELPRSAPAGVVRRLALAGLVELLPGHCYRIKGYDTERTARQDAARIGAAGRWQSEPHSERNAARNANAMPNTETETETEIYPPSPSRAGGRKNGTNPRAKGTSPRQVEERVRRDAPRRLGEVMRGARDFEEKAK